MTDPDLVLRQLAALFGGRRPVRSRNHTGKCIRCSDVRVLRGRGLCFKCHKRHRHEHPVTSKYGRRGVANQSDPHRPGGDPTAARPGSPEKIAVLTERAANKRPLFHPDDETLRAPTTIGPTALEWLCR